WTRAGVRWSRRPAMAACTLMRRLRKGMARVQPNVGGTRHSRGSIPARGAPRPSRSCRALQFDPGLVGDSLHGGAEDLGTMGVVPEHVEAGASRRHQYGIARAG